jgi:hypothetical protein
MWTIALAPLSPTPMITQRPWPTGVIVQVGLAPLVFTIPVQSPWRVNGPVKPGWTNRTGTGEEVTLANWMLRGVTPTGDGLLSGGGFEGTVDGTGVGVAAVAETAYTAK